MQIEHYTQMFWLNQFKSFSGSIVFTYHMFTFRKKKEPGGKPELWLISAAELFSFIKETYKLKCSESQLSK